MFIKYIKSVLWRLAKCLSYTEEARCLKVKEALARPIILQIQSIISDVPVKLDVTRNWQINVREELSTLLFS